MRRVGPIVVAVIAGLMAGARLISVLRLSDRFGDAPEPETIAAASLQSGK